MERIEIIDTTADNICNYGFCGYKDIKQEGYRRKINWLKKRFAEGMKFKILHSTERGAVRLDWPPPKHQHHASKQMPD